MGKAGIFGFEEDGWGEVRNGLVHVVKDHRRSARDAAVPPGQAIELEFHVAEFPFRMAVTHGDDDVATTERRIPMREGGASIRDRIVPFEITLTPPNGLAPLVYTNPEASTISRWPNDTVGARIDASYIERGKGTWKISVRNINPSARRMHVHVQSVHAVTNVRHQDIPLPLLNRLSAVALAKALPAIEYDRGNIVVSTPAHFVDPMGSDRAWLADASAAKADGLPTFTPISAKLLSQADFAARIEQRIAALTAEFQTLVQRYGLAMVARQHEALQACRQSLASLRALPSASAAFCIVLEGMFTEPNVDLRLIGTVAEIDDRIPQIGLVFDEEIKLSAVITNLTIHVSPLLTKTLLATGAAVAVSALADSVLGTFAPIGGELLYNSIDDLDLEEEIRGKLREKGAEISGYVTRALGRITDLGASALYARIHSGAAASGSDNLHIQYFNPSDIRPPRPRPPWVDGMFEGGIEKMVLASGERAGCAPAERETTLTREAAGPVPPGFDVPSPETGG